MIIFIYKKLIKKYIIYNTISAKMFYKNLEHSYQNNLQINLLSLLDKTIKTIKPIVQKAPEIVDKYEKIIYQQKINQNIIIYNNLYLKQNNYFINTSTNKISSEQIQRAFQYCVDNSLDEQAFEITQNFIVDFDKICTKVNKPIHFIIIKNNMTKTFEYMVNNYNIDFEKIYDSENIIEFCNNNGSKKFLSILENLKNNKEIV